MDYIYKILPPLLEGAGVTLQVFAATLVLAVPLGLALALLRLSSVQAASTAVAGYIWLMRGTPLMLQMLFIYFALPFVPVMGIRLPDFPAAIVAFVLNYAAYFAEIFRAGIQSIARGNTKPHRYKLKKCTKKRCEGWLPLMVKSLQEKRECLEETEENPSNSYVILIRNIFFES